MQLSNYSITKQFVVMLSVVSTVILLMASIFSVLFILFNEQQRFIRESELEANFLAETMLSHLAFFDAKGAEDSLKSIVKRESILHVAIYDSSLLLFAEANPDHLPPPIEIKKSAEFIDGIWISLNSRYRIIVPIIHQDELLGYFYILKSASKILQSSQQLLAPLLIFSLFLIVIVLIVSWRLGNHMLRPILSLAESAKLVAEKRNFSHRVSYPGKNEVAALYEAFNLMLIETQSLTDELEERVDERTKLLLSSIDTLREAQDKLIQSEKMAALGSLVSGVAHEVNTPLGNAIMGSSIISRESKAILQEIQEGTLKRSVMDTRLGIILESSQLLEKSIKQAAELITSFKRISVDQSTDDLRDFDLREYVEEVFLTFHNKLKHIPIEVEIIAPKEVLIYSHPGVFAQLLNNFINNTILHAFDSNPEGAKITTTISMLDKGLQFTYSDNGKGVDETVKDKIFEPFVTTKRNAGGTGLGMNIVYNLVTQKLEGSILMRSEMGQGTKFELYLPYIEKSDTTI
jgi:signal transduction histidine kinase